MKKWEVIIKPMDVKVYTVTAITEGGARNKALEIWREENYPQVSSTVKREY